MKIKAYIVCNEMNYITHFLAVLRSLRILRFISFIRGLHVLVHALLTTFLISVIPFLFFLLIIVFVYGVVGYYVFGYRDSGDSERWGNLSRSMLSLITFVTVSCSCYLYD